MKYALLTCAVFLPLYAHADNWPSWRGDVTGSGYTLEKDLPTEWGPEKNVKWRVELPERGNSTPVAWGDRVFVTQAVDAKNWRGIFCFDAETGKKLWEKGLTYEKEERSHKDNPYCSASPATDGSSVFVSYGSAGFVSYDMDGNELWKRDFGAIDHTWGNSTSPVIYGDLVIHYHGPDRDNAFLAALNKKTGETVWKWDEPRWQPGKRTDGFQGRDDEGIIGSWSTPIILPKGNEKQLVMSFPMEIKSFNPETGEVLWTSQGLNPLVYTSPVSTDNVIVAMGGYYGNSLAVDYEGNRVWHEQRHFGGIGTGVVHEGHLYAQDSGGIARCVEMKTGKTVWKERLPGKGKSWGSWVKSGDRIYTLSQPGDSVVFQASPEKLKVIAVNDLGEHTNSSPVVSDGNIFIRTYDSLWCIGK